MATIALYANKISQMPGLITDVKKSVTDYKSELSTLKTKMLAINKSVCNLDDVMSSIQTSTLTQEKKIASLDSFNRNSEQFISEVIHIDGNVADVVKKRKDDFYTEYSYLKPDSEKNGWEKFSDNVLKPVAQWCKDHWVEIAVVIAAVVITILAGGAALILIGILALLLSLTGCSNPNVSTEPPTTTDPPPTTEPPTTTDPPPTTETTTTDEHENSHVTAAQLQEFGWGDISEQELAALNATLERYGITSKESIILFLATCGHESGKGNRCLEWLTKDGNTIGDYLKTERGTGYIQITWRDTHLSFLKTVNDSFDELDTATYIAEYYPWEASGWFWSSPETKKSSEGLSLNEFTVKYGDSKGTFFITQCLVNGWPKGLSQDVAIAIRDGNISWEVKKEGTTEESYYLYVDGKKISKAPNGWEDRVKNYNEAINSFN